MKDMTSKFVETPVTKTLIPEEGKWKNKLYVREYKRMIYRSKKGSVKPYLDENGNFKYLPNKEYYHLKKQKQEQDCEE